MNFSDYAATRGRPLAVQTGDYLFRQGDHDTSLYVVRSGLLKAYYVSEDGKENIKSFLQPGSTIGSLAASCRGAACTFSLVCLRPAELIALTFADLYTASRNDAELASEIVDFLLAFGIKKEMREYELLCLSAEDRYRRLLDQNPDLLEQVTQNEIARYLGVTPVGLSRIKGRLS